MLKTLKKENQAYGCEQGFRRKCVFYVLYGDTAKCKFCGNGWIDEYCDWCK